MHMRSQHICAYKILKHKNRMQYYSTTSEMSMFLKLRGSGEVEPFDRVRHSLGDGWKPWRRRVTAH